MNEIPTLDELRGFSEESLIEAAFLLKAGARINPNFPMEEEKTLLQDIQLVLSEKALSNTNK